MDDVGCGSEIFNQNANYINIVRSINFGAWKFPTKFYQFFFSERKLIGKKLIWKKKFG